MLIWEGRERESGLGSNTTESPCSYCKEDLDRRGSGYGWQVGSMWVLDFAQERFHKSPGDFESIFIKAEDSDTRKDLGEKKQQERA